MLVPVVTSHPHPLPPPLRPSEPAVSHGVPAQWLPERFPAAAPRAPRRRPSAPLCFADLQGAGWEPWNLRAELACLGQGSVWNRGGKLRVEVLGSRSG